MTILYVEDEEDLADLVTTALTRAGYRVQWCADGNQAFELADNPGIALILLDGMLPGMDGLEICRRLRARRDNVPILMLTARDTDSDQIRGLESGADDYLTKPFSLDILIARIRALLRREAAHRADRVVLRDLTLHFGERTATRAGLPLPLTPREWDLLELLVRNEGRTVSREKILQRAWDAEERIGSNMVDVYIKQLRRKIDDGAEHKLIQTVHGTGYTLVRPPDASRA
jgi:DNA-binding response OmpR family regulator